MKLRIGLLLIVFWAVNSCSEHKYITYPTTKQVHTPTHAPTLIWYVAKNELTQEVRALLTEGNAFVSATELAQAHLHISVETDSTYKVALKMGYLPNEAGKTLEVGNGSATAAIIIDYFKQKYATAIHIRGVDKDLFNVAI